MSGVRSLRASLEAETSVIEERRLKAGGSQDWLPRRAAEPQPEADRGVGRGPGGPPHQIVAGCEDLRVL